MDECNNHINLSNTLENREVIVVDDAGFQLIRKHFNALTYLGGYARIPF